MENQEKLNKGIGDKEVEKLKPEKVKVLEVGIKEVKNVSDKVYCKVKHSDSDDPIEISAVEYSKDKKLKVSGLWYKMDEDGLIQKNSALAILLNVVGVKTPSELKDKELDTVADDKGFLCFKAY